MATIRPQRAGLPRRTQPGLASGARARWGDAYDSFKVPGYARVDLGGRLALGKGSEPALKVRNLADRRYVEYLNGADNVYQGERRNVSLTLRHAF